MNQNNLDKRAILHPGLAELRTTLQGALQQFSSDPALRRALIHAEGVVADRLGEARQARITGVNANRATRRTNR